MASETRTFTGISRAQVGTLRERIAAFVRLPDGDTGAIDAQGMKGSFAYDEPAQTLSLTIDEVPFFIPRPTVWSAIEGALGR